MSDATHIKVFWDIQYKAQTAYRAGRRDIQIRVTKDTAPGEVAQNISDQTLELLIHPEDWGSRPVGPRTIIGFNVGSRPTPKYINVPVIQGTA